MKSIRLFFTNLFNKIVLNKKQKENSLPKSSLPKGYKKHRFSCWLCGGTTDFGIRSQSEVRIFTIDCSRCGVDNKVRVQPFE